MKVLIIDDEPHIRQMMRLTLEAAGYQVDEAADGQAGLDRFGDGGGYDAVVLDQKMPGLDGLETLRRIKERAPDACVLMVTAFASIELAVDAMRLGATDFLRKPMTPEMLRGAVAAAIAGKLAAADAEVAAPRPAGQALEIAIADAERISDSPSRTRRRSAARRRSTLSRQARRRWREFTGHRVASIPRPWIACARLTHRRLEPGERVLAACRPNVCCRPTCGAKEGRRPTAG